MLRYIWVFSYVFLYHTFLSFLCLFGFVSNGWGDGEPLRVNTWAPGFKIASKKWGEQGWICLIYTAVYYCLHGDVGKSFSGFHSSVPTAADDA